MHNRAENGEQCSQTEEYVGTVPADPQHYPTDVRQSGYVRLSISVCVKKLG